jgi:hypothetical protein
MSFKTNENKSQSRNHSGNSGYLKTTHLPPLDLTKSLTRRLVGSNKESKHRRSSHNKNSNPLSLSVDSADLPDTENKKKSPKNIEPIETSFILDNYGPVIKNYSRNLETPVTIDILTNESGRNSRQSLGHITNRDILSSRFSIVSADTLCRDTKKGERFYFWLKLK